MIMQTTKVFRLIGILFLFTQTLSAQRVTFVRKDAERKVDVLVDGQLFTAYIYPSEDTLKKPVLFPIKTAYGTTITRGYPLEPRANERTDHPHHVGLWMNYEDVNGYDYWNNSTAITPENRLKKYGLIRHTGIQKMKDGKVGMLVTTADWVNQDGKGQTVLKERTVYRFSGKKGRRIIDRETTLTAQDSTVVFKDVKDGFIGLRLARQMEHPSNKAEIFTDANGIETKTAVMNNEGVVGHYRNPAGVEGEAVWSTRGAWMNLSGKIGDEDIDVAMIDHPSNISYPTYWHARGYGLFAANPLGAKVFSNGKTTLNTTLKPGGSVVFRYRVVVQSGRLSDGDLNELAADFAKRK